MNGWMDGSDLHLFFCQVSSRVTGWWTQIENATWCECTVFILYLVLCFMFEFCCFGFCFSITVPVYFVRYITQYIWICWYQLKQRKTTIFLSCPDGMQKLYCYSLRYDLIHHEPQLEWNTTVTHFMLGVANIHCFMHLGVVLDLVYPSVGFNYRFKAFKGKLYPPTDFPQGWKSHQWSLSALPSQSSSIGLHKPQQSHFRL